MAWGNRPCFCGDSLLCRSGLPVSGIDFGTGRDMNLHCGATRPLCRERCVQRSLPCVGKRGGGDKHLGLWPQIGVRLPRKPYLQKRLRVGLGCGGKHLGCNGQTGDCSADSVAIGSPFPATFGRWDQRGTAPSATGGSCRGNPTRPKPQDLSRLPPSYHVPHRRELQYAR